MSFTALVSALTALLLTVTALISTLADDVVPNGPVASRGEVASRETTVQVLRPLATLVGDWKGVGQPKRGSTVGAWSEKATAVWKFEDGETQLMLTFEPGRQFVSATFSVAADGRTPQLVLTPFQGDAVLLSRIQDAGNAQPSDDTWIFESASGNGPQTRCTLRILKEIRITLLFEERLTQKGTPRRLAEIGLTRAGSKLASSNTGERQCIVTGGLGSMKVSHEGKTYYVCCEGCKQAFDADPEGTLKAYRERLRQNQ